MNVLNEMIKDIDNAEESIKPILKKLVSLEDKIKFYTEKANEADKVLREMSIQINASQIAINELAEVAMEMIPEENK